MRDWVLFLQGLYEVRALTIRLKTLIIVAITSVGLVIVLYGASHFFLLREFIAIEQSSARENAERARSALIDGASRFLDKAQLGIELVPAIMAAAGL